MSPDLRVPGILTCPPEKLAVHGLWYLSDYTFDMQNSPFFRCPFVWYWIQFPEEMYEKEVLCYGKIGQNELVRAH